MAQVDFVMWLYVLTPAAIVFGYGWRVARRNKASIRTLAQAREEGLMEPASLHPVIDSVKCIGCASCATACPEGNVLGIIDGKSHLINPSHCIGHGACKVACPVDAITLVFGTEKRGVDIPMVSENFETNIPGIFIAGELGGMGLIRNAVEQGRQAMESIRKRKRPAGADLDVLIIGAGPAGFSASLSAMEHGMRYVTVEQDSLGGTVFQFPRGKIVMTAPVTLPMVGKVRIRETTKEALLDFWKSVEGQTGIKINYNERMERITREGDVFVINTSRGEYRTGSVLLAIGRRGTPRKLGVPGEELPKVVYRLIDPEQYRNKRVVVVGGGDSALEAAISISEQEGSNVVLSYRGDGFNRAKDKNRKRIQYAETLGQLQVYLNSNVKQIMPERVKLDCGGEEMEIENDAVIISAGGVLPTALLKEIGIVVETRHGT